MADTSLPYDRGIKLPLYARAGIPELWIVDLEQLSIEVLREPTSAGFAARRVVESGTVSPAAFPDLTLAVAEILPPAR